MFYLLIKKPWSLELTQLINFLYDCFIKLCLYFLFSFVSETISSFHLIRFVNHSTPFVALLAFDFINLLIVLNNTGSLIKLWPWKIPCRVEPTSCGCELQMPPRISNPINGHVYKMFLKRMFLKRQTPMLKHKVPCGITGVLSPKKQSNRKSACYLKDTY